MADATVLRLDTAELALEAGWEVDTVDHTDEFSRGGVRISVRYTTGDEMAAAVKRGPDGVAEDMEHRSGGKLELLRYWLTGRTPPAAAGSQIPVPDHLKPKPDQWTREEFVAAVADPADRAFLVRLLELIDENSRQSSAGMPIRLAFGKRGTGAMFVYPLGRRNPPFQFSVKGGSLMIAGGWKLLNQVKGHPGFGELAALLGLDERGPATWVPVSGLDADEVWAVGERVSRAIN